MILPEDDYKKILSTVPIVCVDCLVMNEQKEFLLVKRKNQPLKDEYWVPGGRVHKNEKLASSVHRKMRDEIGVEVEIVRLLGFFEEIFLETKQNAQGGVHSISFLYEVKPMDGIIKLDHQSADWGWFKDMPTRLRGYCDQMNSF